MRPLEGIKVIEMTHMLSGPTAGLLLADLGADVVKLEKTDGGEDTRRMVPPSMAGESASFMVINRGKRGLALNIKSADGLAILKQMLSQADILLENYRLGTLEKLGLSYEELYNINPRLIYCQITGFGITGPYAERPGLDLITQGMSGLMSVTGEGPGRAPIKAGGPLSDISAGHIAVSGILAAYIQRLKTGKGQHVDTSLLEAAIVHTYWISSTAFATGHTPVATGSAHAIATPYQALATKDGYVNVGCATQGLWERLLKVLGDEHLATDKRFQDNPSRHIHRQELILRLGEIFSLRKTTHWVDALSKGGVPCGPVLSITDMHRDPQVLERKMVIKVQHSILGEMDAIGCPVKLSGSDSPSSYGAPILGEHSIEVLTSYGIQKNEIAKLVESGVVLQGDATAK